MKRLLFFLLAVGALYNLQINLSGCAQIVAPTGGARDTIPPKLINASPKNGTTNFKGNRITLDFNEYVQTQDVLQNLLVSPTPKTNPNVDYKLRTVTIKLRDTLEPNTTYTIDLGNSIRDINENNAVKDFRYVFSTGPTLDSMEFSGKVQLAETGKTDSTIIVMLYKNLDDSAVLKQKPKYIARLDHDGNFTFNNLAPGTYKVYALKEDNGSRTYDSKTETFAFADSVVNVNKHTADASLYAYVEEPKKSSTPPNTEKKLRYTTSFATQPQDILNDVTIEFNKPLKNFDRQKIMLADTLNNIYKDVAVTIDSTNKKVVIKNKWIPDADYKLIILKDLATDTTGLALTKSDTVRFRTKKETDYGSLILHFPKFDNSKKQVLEFVVGNQVVNSFPLTSKDWSSKLFSPGEYELRILYDENNNGKWDPGNYQQKHQPEKVISVPNKITVKANWENEINIEL